MINQLIQELNRNFFFPRSMRLDILKNTPEVIPTLAQWLYEEWHPYDPSLTQEKLIGSLGERLNENNFPITFVVFKDTFPIGTISLKKQPSSEFSDLPEDSLWMKSFQVIPEERGYGIGQALLEFAAKVARHFHHKEIYFYTSNPNNVPWYLKRGSHVIEQRSFRNHMITIMNMPTN